MKTTFYVALGGGMGSLCRYWLSSMAALCFGNSFPYGTLLVNILGSLLMGLLVVFNSTHHDNMAIVFRSLCLIGFLGGFTTFSAFSIETLTLLESGNITQAIGNVLLNVGLCLTAVWLGASVGRSYFL